ncbi:MAG: lipid-binding SYLF domain-containing protein [Bryobacteraceae bacterium]
MFSGSVYAADAKAQTEVTERLQAAGTIFSDITKAPDNGIPDELLQKAHCAVVVPSLKKGALIVSAKYGKGFVTCRRPTGWSAPAAIRIEGGGVGFQIGGSETELVLLVMNDRGAQRLMSSQFTIGGESEIAAGPVGRNATAQTDGKFTAEILSWSRARGVFAGIALQGGTLRQDEEENEALYGKKLTTEQIVNSSMAAPAAAGSLLSQLNAHSPVEKK